MKNKKTEYPEESVRLLRSTALGLLFEHSLDGGEQVHIRFPQIDNNSAALFNSFARRVGQAFYRYAFKHAGAGLCFVLTFHIEVSGHEVCLEWRGFCGKRESFTPGCFARLRFAAPDFHVLSEALDK